jgi:glutamate carboxypeptidase
VLSCEPSAATPETLLLGASDTGAVHLKVRGRLAHAGVNPEPGRNVLIELAHQLLQTEDVAKAVPGTQLNWTLSRAGSVLNQIPESASARWRYAPYRARRLPTHGSRAGGTREEPARARHGDQHQH